MHKRSFLERDMAYTAAGKFSSKLLVEVEEIISSMENHDEP